MAVKKATTCSGVPVNLARRSSRCVAIPVGQVSRWHWRAMSQPMATSAAVPNPNSSAPSMRRHDDVATGLQPAVGAQRDPVAQPVADQHLVRPRPGRAPTAGPACLIEVSGDAPVPPEWPLTMM